jgi:hypothetical protein
MYSWTALDSVALGSFQPFIEDNGVSFGVSSSYKGIAPGVNGSLPAIEVEPVNTERNRPGTLTHFLKASGVLLHRGYSHLAGWGC